MAEPGARIADSRRLLALPPPATGKIPPSDTRPPFRPVRKPNPRDQGERLTPQFDVLRDALANERAELSDPAAAPDPELVAVFDVAGTVDGFLRATQGIDGLEFLADLQEDYVQADENFFYEQAGVISEDPVPESLYMVMTNARAVTELIRLFELWQDDKTVKFTTGLNPLKNMFSLLRSIRRWGAEDRVRETGLLDQWREDLEVVGSQGFSRVEIELWYRTESSVRSAALSQVSELVRSSGGNVITSLDEPAIAYLGILADIPMSQVRQVIDIGPGAIDLLTTERIMMVVPSVPMSFPQVQKFSQDEFALDATLPTGKPRIALFDGVPMANHSALEGRLSIDDADGHVPKYSSQQRSHGTAMASLIIHGDLSAPGKSIRQPLYVRPILEPHEFIRGEEILPPDKLLVDLIHRAFRRLFEDDGSQPPAAPSVRIVNLSIGDPARQFVRRLSPLARLIDWLAHTYNLVVIVSAGNHGDVDPIVRQEELTEDEGATTLMRALHLRASTRRLLSPAEAINVLTVGALHDDDSIGDMPDTILDLLPKGTPASYSPYGFGFRRSVKPEILLPGGRQVFMAPPPGSLDEATLNAANVPGTGPGLRVAAPGTMGDISATAFSCGTSNSAALATRSVNAVFDALEGLSSDKHSEFPFPDQQYYPVLAKTLTVHASGWFNLQSRMSQLLGFNSQNERRELTRLLGYGPLHVDRMVTADRRRVVLLGAGSISKDQRHSFNFPLPSALSATTEWRRLTVSLGWLSPVNVRSQRYRMARLWFSTPREILGVAAREADHNAVLKGTVQHQVFEGRKAVAFVDGSNLAIDVDCREDARTLRQTPIRYGLVASIEVSANIQVDIHEQVRLALRQEVQTRARARVSGG